MSEAWYEQLSSVKSWLVEKDPNLRVVFDVVDAGGFQLHTVIKNPYTSLVAAIIGQKISFVAARSLRGQLYSRYGTELTPQMLQGQNLSFLGTVPATIIANVTEHIIVNNIDLNVEANIRSLTCVKGIGAWTIDTTLLTCLAHWDLFPLADKFLQARMKRLYGTNCNMTQISAQWAPYRSIVTWYLWRWF